MSSSEYDKALRIELRPSQRYRTLILSSHLASLLPLSVLVTQHAWFLLLLPPLALSTHQWLGRWRRNSRWTSLRLHRDGRIVLFDGSGGRKAALLRHHPTQYTSLVILPLHASGVRLWLPLFSDAMDGESWRALQVYLRFHLLPGDGQEPVRG